MHEEGVGMFGRGGGGKEGGVGHFFEKRGIKSYQSDVKDKNDLFPENDWC